MVIRGFFGAPARVALLFCIVAAWLLATVLAPAAHAQTGSKRILLYTGTTGFRHTDGINNGRPVVQAAIEAAGYTVDWEDCTNNGGGANNCDNANKNPRIFTDENLARYDAVVLLNSSAGPPGPLWSDAQKASIIKYVQNGGGIAGVHNATDMGTTAETWNWWDGNNGNSVVGATMAGHAATSLTNVAQVQVADHNHLATRDVPDTYGMGDEHYNFRRNVRGTHHVLATLDERTYTPGGNAMGQDHPVTWCKLYDGDNINDNTGTAKNYSDGRTWVTSMGHFGQSYTENPGNNNLIKQIVGGVRWVAGEGRKSDCSGTVWSAFSREVIVPDANNPIGIDVAKDGKVYWSEIGNPISLTSTGYVKMYDPTGSAGNKTTVITIPTRADHGNSEDGVLGMSLQPGFDLADPTKRNIFVYYSPRNDAWPSTGNVQVVGYNQISRWTLNAAGTEAVAGSERVILRVPKAKISGSPSGFAGGPTDSGPGHVGGAGLDFDSAGNLYLGVGDDVSPNASGHNGYPPMDFRAQERWDARKTSANSADLRGKVVRIKPLLGDIPSDATPGVDTTYSIPAGNLFAPGTPKTRPEIYAMGFRQPFTLHTDPKNPGIVGVGEYCHDNSANAANRAPAGTCEWNLIGAPGNFGWPFCVGNNSTANTTFRWNYATNATGPQYDCSAASMPSDIRYAPSGQTAVEPTNDGLDTLPGPAVPATVWKKYTGEQGTADFGDLGAGGMQPMAGPIYRYDEATASQGAFPRYYDGSWIINNRGADNGFWKEVHMRKDNNQMLRTSDWLPYNSGATSAAQNSSLVIGSQFGPDGSLYLSRFSVGCCRSNTSAANQNQIVKISFNVQDECLTDANAPTASHEVTGQAYPDTPNTYVNTARLRLAATDSGCAGVKNIEYRVNGETDWHAYSNELTYNTAGTYNVEYRATDRKDNVSAVKTATFTVLQINDTTAPTTNATAAGNKDQRDNFVGSATVTVTATDDEFGSGVHSIEYRVNGGAWNAYTAPVAFNAPGNYSVDYRATDKVQNTSAVKTLSFRILSGAGCTLPRSDEFSGTTIGSQWLRHTRNGGTPTEGALAPTIGNGVLTMPTNNLELDSNSATTALGPINFLGQDLPSLGNNWSVETQFTVQFTGGWQHAGLIVWQADNNFFRSTITHSLSDDSIYIEQSKDNPSSTEGARVQAQGNINLLPNDSQPVTIRMRYTRVPSSDTVQGQFRVIAPASVASADWVNFPATNGTWNSTGGLSLQPPSNGTRRDAAGSRVGIIAAGNFPGQTGAGAYTGTPGTVAVDYFRVTPDPVTCETDAPTTTATLDPAAPATGDTYNRSVKVNLSATDTGTPSASGVEYTEYRVTTNGVVGDWVKKDNTAGTSPFANELTVSSSGTHLVEFRSGDKAANTEAIKSVTFKVQLPVCDRSDEFDGNDLLPRWQRHTRNGGTPTTGALAPTLTGTGQLRLPTNDLEIDAAAATSVGPINFIHQDLAQLGDNWQVETQFTATYRGGWQNIGLAVWQADGNFFRSTLTHSLSTSAIYLESSKDAPGGTNGEGTRTGGSSRNILATNTGPVTIKMRYTRVPTSDIVAAEYQILAPASAATTGWTAFPTVNGNLNLNTNPRRDSAGSRIGLIAQDNWPAGGTFPSNGTPAIAMVDYFRVTPDVCPPEADTTAPTTSHALAPATPNGLGGYWTSPVNVTLTGTDNSGGAGIDKTEYRVDGGAFTTYTAPIAVATDGNHSVEYRSVDKNGNVEATKSVALKLDTTAPSSAALLNPGTPGPGGTYDGPVELGLTGTDATSGVAKLEYQVNTVGAFKAFGVRSLAASAALEWVTYDPANKPVFSAPGQYSIDYRATDAAGNVETAKSVAFSIRAVNTDHDAPVTTAVLDPAQPGAGKTYATAVNVNLSALDPAPAGPAPKTVDSNAFGNSWDPSALNLTSGDTVRWNFPASEGQPHDVWIYGPGKNPDPAGTDLEQVTSGIVFPGGASVTKTLAQTGTWTFLCRLHSSYSAGAWSGMVGTAVVAAGQTTNPASGVDYTEYRVKTGDAQGDWVRKTNDGGANPFASTFQITAEGSHVVEYRSVDKAGNAETAKSVAFSIDMPDPGFPVIQAFADPSSGAAPLLVRFTATGFDPDGGSLSYKWEFADGTALGRAVTRTYTTPGTYTAKVTATDDEGKTSSKDVQVVVTSPNVVPPTVDATSDVSRGAAPLKVQFNAAGNDPDGPENDLLYTWDFGDGGTSLAQNPAHSYNTPGTYTAKVTVAEESGATATDTVEVVVTDPVGNRPPTVEIGALPKSGKAPLDVLLTAHGSDPDDDDLTYSWDFDDGSAAGRGESVTHRFEHGGTYTVKVTASDGRGGTGTAEFPIVVGNPTGNQAPRVSAAADPKTGTAPLKVDFSSHAVDPDGDALLVTWAFGDGGQAAGTEAEHTYTAVGTYTATVTAMDPTGATGTATVQVVVSAAPTTQQTTNAAGTDTAPAPQQAAWFGVSKPATTTVSSFASRGLSVQVTCTEAMSGTAKVTVSTATRKALKLKSGTLATGTVRCDGAGSERVTLKVSKTVKRALASTKRSVKATLTVRLRSAGEPATQSTRTITLTRR